ncbi:universal stress protein [Pseudomonas sp. p1(2021b)]|uniref:universal stress protein n=1 Tax=Pseudomonas sp. p1(2021b) TaxID=2874628 RepID=UPI001CCBBE36|nr:universal stress protein [Pseudomonas sp. p1(2021b)]UBM27446.1 universal stress protein [Pseudomonas sp. p1(2021b)]
MTIRKLLVLSPSHTVYSPAIEQAAELAAALHAPVQIAMLGKPLGSVPANQLQARLENQVCDLRARGALVLSDAKVLEGTAKRAFEYIEQSGADLVLKDPEVDDGATSSSLDMALALHAPCPVLLAHGRYKACLEKLFIAAPASCEDMGEQALNAHVIKVAKAIGHSQISGLHVFSVYDQAALLRHSEHYSLAEIPRYEALAVTFRQFTERQGIPALHRHLIVGACAQAICAYANRCDYDLVVIASPQNTRQQDIVRYLLDHLDCSLLVVSPPITATSRRVDTSSAGHRLSST